MPPLPDGHYDVIVIEAESAEHGEILLEVTITMGPHLGRTVPLRWRQVHDPGDGRNPRSLLPGSGDPLGLLGVPGVLRVRRGEPEFRPERA